MKIKIAEFLIRLAYKISVPNGTGKKYSMVAFPLVSSDTQFPERVVICLRSTKTLQNVFQFALRIDEAKSLMSHIDACLIGFEKTKEK